MGPATALPDPHGLDAKPLLVRRDPSEHDGAASDLEAPQPPTTNSDVQRWLVEISQPMFHQSAEVAQEVLGIRLDPSVQGELDRCSLFQPASAGGWGNEIAAARHRNQQPLRHHSM